MTVGSGGSQKREVGRRAGMLASEGRRAAGWQRGAMNHSKPMWLQATIHTNASAAASSSRAAPAARK